MQKNIYYLKTLWQISFNEHPVYMSIALLQCNKSITENEFFLFWDWRSYWRKGNKIITVKILYKIRLQVSCQSS